MGDCIKSQFATIQPGDIDGRVEGEIDMKMMMSRLCVAVAIVLGVNLSGMTDSWVRFSDDGSRIVVKAAGVKSFEAGSSAVYEWEGKNHRVATKGFKLLRAPSETTGTTPFGDAVITTALYGRDDSPFKLTLRLKRLQNLRSFTLQGIFHNGSDSDVKLRSFDLIDLSKGGGSFAVNNPADWLVTPLMEDSDAQPLSEMSKSLNEVALFRCPDGNSFLIGSRFVDPTKTRLQIFRELYTLYREAAGDDMYILSCLGRPTRGVVGFIDSARVGPDSHPAHFNKCLKSVLRFTPLPDDGPTLIGTDLHLSIGATEIDNLRTSPTSVVIDLSDAGAQQGSLTFYSVKELVADGSENCEITSVENPGDNLWCVNITGRKWGKAQQVSLKVVK